MLQIKLEGVTCIGLKFISRESEIENRIIFVRLNSMLSLAEKQQNEKKHKWILPLQTDPKRIYRVFSRQEVPEGVKSKQC